MKTILLGIQSQIRQGCMAANPISLWHVAFKPREKRTTVSVSPLAARCLAFVKDAPASSIDKRLFLIPYCGVEVVREAMDGANLICQVLFNSNQVNGFINVVFPTGSLNGIKSFLELIQSMRIRLEWFPRDFPVWRPNLGPQCARYSVAG